MEHRSSFGIIGAVLALTLALAGTADAQQVPIVVDGRAGIGLPISDLGDLVDPGPAFNFGVSFGISDRFLIRADGGAELYEGIELGEPLGNEGINDFEVDLIHFHGGGTYYLVPPEDDSRFFVSLTGMGGVTNFNVPRLAASVGNDAIEFELSELYPSASGGVSLGYAVHEQVSLYLDGHTYLVFGDEEDTAEVIQVAGAVADVPESLGTVWSVPVTAGVRLTF